MTDYAWVGKRVRVHLYTAEGRLLGAVEGRVADVSPGVTVGHDAAGRPVVKDLLYVVDIAPRPGPDGEPVPYTNSAGTDGEGWFAVHDATVLPDAGPPLFSN